MKRSSLLPVAACLAALLTVGACDFAADDDAGGGVVTLTGQVLDAGTNNPVPAAYVRALPFDLLFEADEEGRYAFDLEIDSTMEVAVAATKDGYGSVSMKVLALAGRTVNVPALRINQQAGEAPVSGKASNILLLSQSAQNIGVRESGSQEVARLTFQVTDSLGRPVVLAHGADVRFALGVGPGGGAFVHPTSARTDNNGEVSVNLSSGTRAGVAQVVAEAEVGGRLLRSLPVSVAIHGGLPDQAHFSLAPAKANFPGLRWYGLADPVSVIVGDQHGNPVKQGTAVYFTTDAGVVEGSVLTDAQGRGTVDLLSANPLPADGVAVVTATTADKDQQAVTAQAPVVFSGVPVVTVSPTTARLGQTYDLRVTDPNGNPLAAGTTIAVNVEGAKVKAVGNTSVTLDDTAFLGGLTYDHVQRGPGITDFTFRAVEDAWIYEDGTPQVETITITVSGPNGSLEIVLSGEAGAAKAASATPGVPVSVRRTDDALRVQLAE